MTPDLSYDSEGENRKAKMINGMEKNSTKYSSNTAAAANRTYFEVFSIGIHVQPPAVLVRSCWPLLLNLASVYQRVWTRTTGVFLRVDSLVLLLPSLSSIFPSSWLFEKWSVVRPFSPFSGVVAPPADYETKLLPLLLLLTILTTRYKY